MPLVQILKAVTYAVAIKASTDQVKNATEDSVLTHLAPRMKNVSHRQRLTVSALKTMPEAMNCVKTLMNVTSKAPVIKMRFVKTCQVVTSAAAC